MLSAGTFNLDVLYLQFAMSFHLIQRPCSLQVNISLFSFIPIMSTQNSNTLPKIWQVVEIVHHISLLSEPSATLALACTCKLLYNSITSYNSFWHKLYQQKFPRDINTAIDWSEWQLEQEQKVETTETDAKINLNQNLLGFNDIISVSACA
ncbi:hypothetical protein BDF19DRAFT_495497 [Syncephalis fuscata]|nr:hypothetical protein BDF19DRAFT_495497 [Syncephalis fuscata]